jgi:hypothetical protein
VPRPTKERQPADDRETPVAVFKKELQLARGLKQRRHYRSFAPRSRANHASCSTSPRGWLRRLILFAEDLPDRFLRIQRSEFAAADRLQLDFRPAPSLRPPAQKVAVAK